MDYDFLFKILVVGNTGVGKTSLLHRYVDQQFPESHFTTIGVDYKLKTLTLPIRGQEKTIKLQMWDTAGQERFHSITAQYFRGAHGVMLVFSLDDMVSFERLAYWMDMVEQQQVGFKILIGNKCDIVASSQSVSDEMVSAFCQQYPGMVYMKTSAKTGRRVEDAFLDMATELGERIIDMRASEAKRALNHPTPPIKVNAGMNEDEGRSNGKCCGGTG